MDDMDAFERRLASELDRMAGPGRRIDAMAMVRTASVPSPRRRFPFVFSAVRFVVAGAIVALFGGVLLSGVLLVKPDREPAPGVGASAPAETPVAPSPLAVPSAAPVAILPVDWVTVEGDPPFRGDGHSGSDYLLDVAVAPNGEAVIVGGGRSDGLVWWSASGSDWQRITLPEGIDARPRRVIATKEGFVAIGRSDVWTSKDGIDWSGASVQGEFVDLDSVDDRVAILGTLRGTPTVWTSRSDGPWEAATIAERGSGFSPDQLALSPDGVYLVRDSRTGLAQRSEDGLRFTSVELPDGPQVGDGGSFVTALVRVADGFALVGGPGVDADERRMEAWRSSDGRSWRRGDAAPGLAFGVQLGDQRAAARMIRDRADLDSDAPSTYLSFLQADGTWCAVSPPAVAGGFSPSAMAWNEDGTVVIAGPHLPGAPIVWYATGVRCGR